MQLQTVGIVGAGAWGTALACVAKRAGRDVLVWAHEAETAATINETHRNDVFLPGIALDESIRATSRLEEAAGCDVLLLVTPAQHLREIAQALKPSMREGQPVVICSKGIELRTGQVMSQIAAELLPQAALAVLSGPSFAADVARELPAAVTLATNGEDTKDEKGEHLGKALSHALSVPPFRCYWSNDVLGAEIGGAVKNVYAIAAGIVVGKRLGRSAHAGLVTRSFTELARFGVALGGKLETLIGLSGLGDLVLTCGSEDSRNMSLGKALGEGKSVEEALSGRLTVTEGVTTARAMVEIAGNRDIELPIAEAVHAVITGRVTVDDAIGALLARPLRAEM